MFFTDGVSRLSFHALHVLTRCVGTQHRCFDKAFLVFLKHFTAFSQCVVGLFHGNQAGIFANKNTIKTPVNTSGVKVIQFSVWRSMINKSRSLDAMSLNVSKKWGKPYSTTLFSLGEHERKRAQSRSLKVFIWFMNRDETTNLDGRHKRLFYPFLYQLTSFMEWVMAFRVTWLPTLQWSVNFFPPSATRNRLGNQLSTSPRCR